MKSIQLSYLNIHNFKGCKALTLNFAGRSATISGDNATGKTTIYDAFCWLLYGKDSKGRSDFQIKPLASDGQVADHGAVTVVEACLSVDGLGVTFRKDYYERWSTKRGSDAETYDGMTLTVSRALRIEETYTVQLPYNTTYCYDPKLPEGQEVVLTQGVNGQVICTADVFYVNGLEVSRNITAQTVIHQPVNAVIAIGTGTALAEPDTSVTIAPDITAALEQATASGKPVILDGMIVTPEGEVLAYTSADVYRATAYHNSDPGCTIWTATGTLCRVGAIAVDPKVIPYGTRMYIVSNDGKYIYGIAVAEDCGGAIKGKRIDLYYDSVAECNQFGIRDCTVYFLG